MDQPVDAGAVEAVRRGHVLHGACSHVGRGDGVQWSWGAGARRETRLGIVMRVAHDGSWADVWTQSSVDMRHDGYPAETCRMVSRIRSSRLQVVWDSPHERC
jgi:hypothetical protein